MFSWETLVLDTDFHSVIDLNLKKKSNVEMPITIGNHVWIGLRTVIISDGCVAEANSLCNKCFDEPKCLIAGNPAKNM